MSQQPTSLITLTDPRSPAAEAYRTRRTNIYFSSLERSIHTLLVTTVAPGKGESIALAIWPCRWHKATKRRSWSMPICAAPRCTRFSISTTTKA